MKHLLIFCISACAILYQTSYAECLRFGDVITLKTSQNQKFLSAQKDGTTRADRDQGLQWERFLVLNSNNPTDVGNVHYTDEISLFSYHNNYLVAEADDSVNANRTQIGPWEKWKVWGVTAQGASNSCVSWIQTNAVPYDFALINLQSSTGKFLVADNQNMAVVEATTASLSTHVRVQKDEWTNFYYDTPFPAHANGSPCPHRGRYDGANCFVAKPPSGSPFIYQNNFYYSGSSCALGGFDGANCKVGANPSGNSQFATGGTPFIYNGDFYLTKSNLSVSQDMMCNEKENFAATAIVKSCALDDKLRVGVFPTRPTYNSIGQLTGTETVDISQYEYVKVCYKKKSAWFRRVCKSSIFYSGTYINEIPNLQDGKKYKIKVFLKKVGIAQSEEAVGTFSTDRIN